MVKPGRGKIMTSIQIMNHDIPVEFIAVDQADQAPIAAQAQKMADLVNSKSWTDDQAAAFQIMNKIVFFRGTVSVDGHDLARPGCDQDDAIFYWQADEFIANPDADVHGNTFFHDCWHVVQFRRAGNKYAQGDTEPVEREVDAINRQIEVGVTLGNDDRELQFLRGFRDDQERIKERLRQGIDKAGPHPTGFPHKD
jgi:hypothetical protein